jgi:hypothetical protein
MDVRIEYEKAKVSFRYLDKEYLGEIVCNDAPTKSYWFIFDQIDVKPFGGSVEFRFVNGKLQPVHSFPAYGQFIDSIRTVIEHHLQELCN